MSTFEGSGRFINDGLAFYVDFANKKSFSPNLLNYSNWISGTGSVTATNSYGMSAYTLNGDTIENVRVLGTDPFGSTSSIVWRGFSKDGTHPTGDGGFNTSQFLIDPTKMYRFSVWTKRDGMTVGPTTSGAFYLGVYALGNDGSLNVLNNKNTGANSNCYFHVTSNPSISTTASISPPFLGGINVWTLVVGHMWPAGTPTASLNIGSNINGLPLNYEHQDSGVWTRSGGKIGNLSTGDWIWAATSSRASYRTYHFYSSDSTATQSFIYPRVDLIDGSEPTIQQLLNGSEPIKNIIGNGYNINSTSLNDIIYANNNTNFYSASNGSLAFGNTSKNLIGGYISSTFSVYSASVWINLDSTLNTASPGRPIFQLAPPATTSFGLYIGDGTTLLTGETIFLAAGTGRTGVIGVNIAPNEWHNIVINWESTSYGIYLDGVALTTTSGTNPHVSLNSSTNYISIGGRDNGTTETIVLDGKISSFAVWQRTLSVNEIARIYKKGRTKLGI